MTIITKNKWKFLFVLTLLIFIPYLSYIYTYISTDSFCLSAMRYSSKYEKITKAKHFVESKKGKIKYNWKLANINKGPPELPPLGFLEFLNSRAYYIHVPAYNSINNNPVYTHLSIDLCGNVNGQGIDL